jgi:Zn-dependent protease with chaperone function
MKKYSTAGLVALFVFALLTSTAYAEQQYIRRASVTGRSGPASYHDPIVVLKKGTAVEIAETDKRWVKVKAGEHDVWIPSNGLVKTKPKTHETMSPLDAGDVSSSPAGLAAAAKGFASSFAKKVKAKQVETLMARTLTARGFLSSLASFHRRHPARTLSYPAEYQDPPLSEGWESKLGLAIAAKLVAHYGLSEDTRKMGELTQLANIIGLQSVRFDIPWRVFILDSNDLNAFGLTDGYILVTQGLLNACHNEEEVAAIMAHEIAHVVRYHNLQELKERKTQLKAAAMDAELDAEFEDEGEDADFADLDEFALQAYTRLHKDRMETYEYEADQLAVVYLYRTGFSARALLTLLETVQRKRGDSEAYSGHPPFSKRIEAIQKFMKRRNLR